MILRKALEVKLHIDMREFFVLFPENSVFEVVETSGDMKKVRYISSPEPVVFPLFCGTDIGTLTFPNEVIAIIFET